MNQNQSTDMSQWATPEQALDLGQMDQLVQKYTELRKVYEAKKAESAVAYHELEAAEKLVKDSLVSAGKSKYFVDGLGTVSLVEKYSFKTPKTPEERQHLFNYIESKYGHDVLMNYLTIHSASLNSFAKKEMEADGTLKIPGLETPTVDTELRFRKD